MHPDDTQHFVITWYDWQEPLLDIQLAVAPSIPADLLVGRWVAISPRFGSYQSVATATRHTAPGLKHLKQLNALESLFQAITAGWPTENHA